MSTTNVLHFPVPEDPPGDDAHRYTVAIIGSGLCDECLCLQYVVSPIPAVLVGDGSLHEGADAGLAIDSRRRVHRDCRSAYRASMTGGSVVGALKIGPAAWPGLGRVTVLFYPFAHTQVCTTASARSAYSSTALACEARPSAAPDPAATKRDSAAHACRAASVGRAALAAISGLEAVAHAGFGEQVPRPARRRFEFVAELGEEDAQVAALGVFGVGPYDGEQFACGDEAAGMA
jgi:hypothetical protein